MNNPFFFQVEQISDNTILFNHFKQQNIFFYYFQVNSNYYLLFFSQKSIQMDFIYESIHVIQELDSKERKLRSYRGFFLYALEIMENGKNYEILRTNLEPFFWRKVKTIIGQNQKGALLKFLFGSDDSCQTFSNNLENQIKTLQNQLNSLQQKVLILEQNQTLEIKKAFTELLKSSQAAQISEQEVRNKISETISEDKIPPIKPFSNNQRYNLYPNIEKGLNKPNFITLGKISEAEKIEIIKLGFQRQAERKIPLKKYYEGTQEYSLFQFKGYQIKYESIRRTKLYSKLKE